MSDAAINLAALLSRDRLPAGEGGTVYLLLQVKTPERGASAGAGEGEPAAADDRSTDGRLPLNLAAVIDRSGSMEGAKLAYTRKAVSFLVDQTQPSDYLSVVTYDDEVDVLQPAAQVTNKDALKAQVHGVRSGGSTNLSGGLLTGVKEVRRHADPGRVNRVLLLTDGLANVGITSKDALVKKARDIRAGGVFVTTLGVGSDFDEDLLVAMAEAGGGNFYYIENPDRIPAIFSQELEGLLSVAGQSLTVRVKTGEGASIEEVLGYPPSGTPWEIEMNLPDIYSGETKSLVLELRVEPGPAGERALAAIELTYEDLLGGQGEVKVTLEVPISLAPADAIGEVTENVEVMKQAYLARSAEAVDEAVHLADQQDFARGGQVLSEMISYLAPMADSDEVVAEQVDLLRVKAAEFAAGHYDADSRKQMRRVSSQTRSGRRQR